MRPTLGLLLALLLAGCRDEPAGRASAKPAAPTAVTSAVVKSQGFDRDGNGKVETWITNEPDGSQLEQVDTDGDGKPDQTRRLEVLEELPPGFVEPATVEPVKK